MGAMGQAGQARVSFIEGVAMESSLLFTAPASRRPLPRASAAASELAGIAQLFDAPAGEWAPCGVSPFAKVQLGAGRPVFHEGARLAALYLLHAGEAKVVRTEDDGYEQVCDFVGPGDLLGAESLFSGIHTHALVALTPVTMSAIPVQAVAELRCRFAGFDQQLKSQLCRRVERLEGLVWQMSAMGAERRLARFLLRTVAEARRRGEGGVVLHLEMSRRDIASHLGLAHESISRGLTSLAARGLVSVHRRDLHIIDLEGIAEFARCTRGPGVDDAGHMPCGAAHAWVPRKDLQEIWRHAA